MLALAAALSARAGNEEPTGGMYAATLGAGAACGSERAAFGGSPAAIEPGGRGAAFEFHRPFGLEDAGVAEAAAFWDFRRLGAALAWRQTEIDGLFREEGWGYRQSYRVLAGGLGPLDVGGAWTFWNREFTGSSETAFSQGYGARWAPLPGLRAGAFVAGLPFDPTRDAAAEIIWQWGVEAASRARGDGLPSQVLRLDFRKTGETPWRILAALSLRPHRSVEITAGLSNPPFQASIGAKFRWSGFETTQSWRYHRYLGGTFLSALGFSSLPP